MRRSRESEEEPRCLTPNQVVAYNLPRARMIRGWTQEQAAEALVPYLGTRWSVANFSAIKRSVDGGRIRQFTADDLVALSRGFDLPIGFFLTPPPIGHDQARIATPDTKGRGADPMVMLDALLGTDDNFEYFEDVVGTWGAFAGRRAVIDDQGRWTDKGPVVPDQLPRARRLARLRGKMVLRQEFGELEAARHVLKQLADVLDDIDVEEDHEPPDPGPRRTAEG